MIMTTGLFYDSKGEEHQLPEGVEPTWRPSAYVVVIKNQKLLMIKSGYSGFWELPGGGVDPGELMTEGAIREAREETGYDVTISGIAPFFLKQTKFHSYYFDKGFYHGILCFFYAELASETQYSLSPSEAKEVDVVEWKDLNDLKSEELTPAIREVINYLKSTSLEK